MSNQPQPKQERFVTLASKSMTGPILDKFEELAAARADGIVTLHELRSQMWQEANVDPQVGAKIYKGYKWRFYRAINSLVEGGSLVSAHGIRSKKHARLLSRPEKQSTDGQ